MAVWTIIPDSDIDPDSPFTTGLATAYRENVIAAFEKASGAPVLANDYIVTAMVADSQIAHAKLSNYTVGDFLLNDNIFIGDSTASTAKHNEIKVGRNGTIRIKYKVTGIDAYFTLRKNGTIADTARVPADMGTLFTKDLTVSVGDLIQMYVNTGGTTRTETSTLAILCNEPIETGINKTYTDYA